MSPTDSDVLSCLSKTRRKLHQHPEEGRTEFETTWFVAEELRKLGFPIKTGIANIDPLHALGRSEEKVKKAIERAVAHGVPAKFIEEAGEFTGVVAEVETGRPGPVTALRFDMDCVCVAETNSPDHIPVKEGFASQNPGLMHACGHDAHTSVGLSVARWVKDHLAELSGTIRLIFQPAEEGVRGAQAMTAGGTVEGVDYLIGAHIGGFAKLGEILILQGGILATTKLDIKFEGIPSHAAADPEKGRSALLAACSAATMIAGIPRHSEGDSRISIGVLHAGEGRNVTPAHAYMQIETRGITDHVNDFLTERVQKIVAGVAEASEVKSSVTICGTSMTLPPSPELQAAALQVAQSIPGIRAAYDSRVSASEDCTVFMNRVVETGGEAVFFMYGANHHGHHRPDFDIQDEAMLNGYRMFTRMVARLNGKN